MARHALRKPPKPEYVPVRVPPLKFKTMLATVLSPFAAMGVYAQLTTAAVVAGAVAIPAMTVPEVPVEPRTPTAITEPASRFPQPYVRLPKHVVEVAQVDPLPPVDLKVAEINKRPNVRERAVSFDSGRPNVSKPYIGRHLPRHGAQPCPPGTTPPSTPTEGGTDTPAPSDGHTSEPGGSRRGPVWDLIDRIKAERHAESTSDRRRDRSDRDLGRGHDDRPERGHGDQDRGHDNDSSDRDKSSGHDKDKSDKHSGGGGKHRKDKGND